MLESGAEITDDSRKLRRRRAWRSPAAWLTLILVLSLGLTADLGSKAWAFRDVVLDRETLIANPGFNPIPWREPVRFMPNVLHFRLVINRGAVFGIGQNRRVFFMAFTIGAIGIGFLLFARWTAAHQHLAHASIGLILAGGVGNLFDRWQHGVVRDFLHLFPDVHLPFGLAWPGGSPEIFPWVFNVADVMLLCGMLLLMIHINRLEKRRDRRERMAGESVSAAETATVESDARAGM